MRLVVISDIHDNLVNLEKFFNWCKQEGVSELICCGDIANGETLKLIADNFKYIYLVRGNLEIYEEAEVKQYKSIKYLGRFGCFKIGDRSVGLCHEKSFIKDLMKKCKCEIIFYGHNHKPWIEKKDGVDLANPGTLGGVFTRATFAVWDSENGELELVILDIL